MRVERLAIDQQHLVVIAQQVVVGARDRHAGVKQLQLEFAKPLLPAARCAGDERVHLDAARDGALERPLQLLEVEAENRNVNLPGGFLDRCDERHEPVLGLDDQLHALPQAAFFFSVFHSTPVPGSGSSAMISADTLSVFSSIGS